MIKQSKNFLEEIPHRSSRYQWIETEAGLVQIHIPRDTWLDKLVRLVKKTPLVMKIDLDTYGSFLWKRIDGNTSVFTLGESFREEFGTAVEPLYDRLAVYLRILKNNRFIYFE